MRWVVEVNDDLQRTFVRELHEDVKIPDEGVSFVAAFRFGCSARIPLTIPTMSGRPDVAVAVEVR